MLGRQSPPQSEAGFILFAALFALVTLGLGSLFVIQYTLGGLEHAGQQRQAKQTFFLADGAASLCYGELRNRLQQDLTALVRAQSSLTAIGAYVANNDPAGFLRDFTYRAGISFGGPFQRLSSTENRLTLTYNAGQVQYACTATVVSRGAPVLRGGLLNPVYLFRYAYTLTGSGAEGGITKQVALQGRFDVSVQWDNFARYALFTNDQRDATGRLIWFTGRTRFTGPMHTNGEFNFAFNPSGTFTDIVTSVSGMARFYNQGSPIRLNADRNGDRDVPTFQAGFQRGVPSIPMPSTTTADQQRRAALGLGSSDPIPNLPTGVHIGQANGSMTGGIYIQGDANVTLGITGGNATYTVRQGSTTTTITVSYASNQTTMRVGSGPSTTFQGIPNGMLFVNGTLTSLSGSVHRDTQLTVASSGDLIITNNLTYQDYTPGDATSPPSAVGFQNVLGLISWNGNIRIATSAPNDINIHATMMTPNGEVRVDNYNTGSPRGIATVLGGVIENTYGPFGTFTSSGPRSGYGRNFVYDQRMGQGMFPPFFPTIGNLIAILGGFNERPNWQEIQ